MANTKKNMALIQSIFLDAKNKALTISNIEELNKILQKTISEFLSVSYEGASMGIAINNLEENHTLNKWQNFYQKYGKNHAAQVHIGLGWAINELNLDLNYYMNNLEPMFKFRVIDGYAYYDGIFRRRRSVRMKQIPENLESLSLRAYDQGLGRSFWYIAQGEVDKLIRIISNFPKERQFDMWRGIGIAIAYVGGVENAELIELNDISGNCSKAFKCGIALVTQSREEAKTSSIYTETICNTLLNLNTSEVKEKLEEIEMETKAKSQSDYFDWIMNIENII